MPTSAQSPGTGVLVTQAIHAHQPPAPGLPLAGLLWFLPPWPGVKDCLSYCVQVVYLLDHSQAVLLPSHLEVRVFGRETEWLGLQDWMLCFQKHSLPKSPMFFC